MPPLSRDPRDPLDPVDPLMNPFSCIFRAPVGKNDQDVALALCFLDFFMTASSISYTFETILGKTTSKNALKKYGFA